MFYKTEYFMIFNCILYFYGALAVLQASCEVRKIARGLCTSMNQNLIRDPYEQTDFIDHCIAASDGRDSDGADHPAGGR